MSELAIVFFKTIKHNSSCVICHAPSPQFHHVNPSEKISEVAKVARMGDLKSTIEELNKCINLCQVHHTAVHKGVLPGFLNGFYDNGRRADDYYARPFMPLVEKFAHKKKKVMLKFYTDHIQREHAALWPLFNAAALPIPRDMLRIAHNLNSSNDDEIPKQQELDI